MIDDLLLPGISGTYVLERLARSPGNEVVSGKLNSSESSAALAINAFARFHDCPSKLPPFPAGISLGEATQVEIEFEAKFPWRGGTHPWLDACVITETHLIGVESKRYEPFRGAKPSRFSPTYFRKPWGSGMDPFKLMRDQLADGSVRYRHLDATQLCKHALGLFNTAERMSKAPVLIYLYAEPTLDEPRKVSGGDKDQHRLEVDDFSSRVAGAAVHFVALSYREWITSWPAEPSEIADHGRALLELYGL